MELARLTPARRAPALPPVCSTPLYCGIVSNVVHLGLLAALVFAAGWGVTGAGLATSLSHWVAIAFLLGNVLRRGYMRCAEVLVCVCACVSVLVAGKACGQRRLQGRPGGPAGLRTRLAEPKRAASMPLLPTHDRLADLARPPKLRDVAPLLRNGVFLSTRSLLAMGAWPCVPSCCPHVALPSHSSHACLLAPTCTSCKAAQFFSPAFPAGMLMWATRLIAGFGAVGLAAHEILVSRRA